MINTKLNSLLAECTSVREAVEKSGMSHKELYSYLNKLGIDMQYPHLWFSQIHTCNHSIETELEATFQ